MTFRYTVTLSDPTASPLDGALSSIVSAAARQWSYYINGSGTVDIQVNVTSTTRANAGPATSVYLGTDHGYNLFESGVANELRTGKDANGAGADLIINVDTEYLKGLWFNASDTVKIPANKTDALSVMMHEIGHGLGIYSYRDDNTGSLPSYEGPFDKLTTLSPDGSVSFNGSNAIAVNGGPVAVTTLKNGEQYSHFANNAADQNGQDLMNGVVFYYGTRYDISKLDLAVMKDLGLSVVNSDQNNVFRFYDTNTGDHFYTSNAYEKASIIAKIPSFQYEGAQWSTPDKSDSTIDVFRFYDTSHGTHFYTTSANERDIIVNTIPNYHYEGVAFQAYASANTAGSDSLTLERFYNTATGNHHFSASAAESYGINHGAAGANWVDEGPGFVVHISNGTLLIA